MDGRGESDYSRIGRNADHGELLVEGCHAKARIDCEILQTVALLSFADCGRHRRGRICDRFRLGLETTRISRLTMSW